MAGPSADRITEWEGGSLSELVSLLQAAALPVRIEVIAPGTTGSNAGEVHLLAGGMADAFAGSLRRDDAMAALQRLEGARYVVECRLPNPESGSLSEPGPHDGSLKDRPLASLMRYCEEYVLTCRLEVWRGQDRTVISYRRGEIIGTTVGGSEGSERLPEVLAWTDGSYEIILPAPVLPQVPSRGRDGAGARADRKRHTTLPMMAGTDARPNLQSSKGALVGAGVADTAASGTTTTGAAGTAAPPPPRSGAAPSPSTTPRPAPPPPVLPSQAPAQQAGTAPSSAAAQKTPARQPAPAAVTPRPIAVTFASPLQPEMTTRGTPPVPAVPLVPAPVPQPAKRPAMQGTAVPLVPPKPVAPAQAKAPAPAPQPAHKPPAQQAAPQAAPQPLQKPVAAQPVPRPLQKPAAAQPAPRPPQKPAAAQPAPQPPQKPAAAQPAPQPLQKPAAAQPAPQPLQKPAAAQPAPQPPQKPAAAQPAPQPPQKPAAAQPAPQPPQKPATPQPQRKPTPLSIQPSAQLSQRPNPPVAQPVAQVAPKASDPAQAAAQHPAQPAPQEDKPLAAPARPSKPASSPATSNDLLPASGIIEAKPKHANYLPPTTPPIQIADEPQMASTEQPATPVFVQNPPPKPRRTHVATKKGIGERPVRVYVLLGLALGAAIVAGYWAYWYLLLGRH
jgi:hypothetical protein